MSQNTRILFLVLPETHVLDLAGPLQVFQEAAEMGARLSIAWCATDLEHTVQTSIGLPLGSMKRFSDYQPTASDLIIIPGATVSFLLSPAIRQHQALHMWLTDAHQRGAWLASICTGAFLLAQAGLLNQRACTTHWKRAPELQQHFPLARVVDNVLYTEQDRIFTSAGVTAGIDLALHLVSRLADEHVAFRVARELVVYVRRNGSEPQHSIFTQYRNHLHSGIHRVQDYMQESLDKGTSLSVLSEIACMSSRNLTRTFKRETGITINAYLNLVRIEKLRSLADQTDSTRKQMARYCGLKSERQVIRLLKQL